MMKILHTGDWHLGHKLYSYDRTEEQLSFLNQIADIVREQQPDVMVVCGDIFHTCNPSTEIQTMFVNALLHIKQNYPAINMIVTAGNHDSYSRLEIDKQLWQKLDIHVVGNVARHEDLTADYDKHIFEIVTHDKLVGYVAAVPYCFMQNFPPVPDDIELNRQNYFFQQLLKRVNILNEKQLPVVLTAHLAITGSDITGHDEMTGGMEYTDFHDLGEGYDYLALGHIHCPQFIKDSNKQARYSGTPIAVNFNENYAHSVTMVEIDGHNTEPKCSTIEIINPKPLVSIPKGDAALPFEEALSQLCQFDAEVPAYLRLNVLVKAGQFLSPDCTDKAIAAVQNKACRFCLINKITEEGNTVPEQLPTYDIDKLQHLSTDDIIKIAQNQGSLTEEEESLLREVIRELGTELSE